MNRKERIDHLSLIICPKVTSGPWWLPLPWRRLSSTSFWDNHLRSPQPTEGKCLLIEIFSAHIFCTLTCQIETLGFLLGLVVAYPRGFLIQMIFFHFWTLWVLSGLWFFKSAWWCFWRFFTFCPCGFSDIILLHLNPAGFIRTAVLQKWLVVGRGFYISPSGFYKGWFSQHYPQHFYSARCFNLAGKSTVWSTLCGWKTTLSSVFHAKW